jgi:hypothetical protein
VARTLERRWETSLLELRTLEDEFDRFSRVRPLQLTDAERSRIAAMSSDIPALWSAESTTNADRKEIIRCLVDRIVVTARRDTEYCDVVIHWKGGYTSQHEVVRPVQRLSQMRDNARLRERITELKREGATAAAIAMKLTGEGFVTARQRGPYTQQVVQQLLRRYGLTNQRASEKLSKDEWWLPELARKLGVSSGKLREWAVRKWCHARQTAQRQRWVIRADGDERNRLSKLRAHSKLGNVSYPPSLTTPKKRKN